MNLKKNKVATWLKNTDTDNDGKLSFTEFSKAVSIFGEEPFTTCKSNAQNLSNTHLTCFIRNISSIYKQLSLKGNKDVFAET